MKNDSDCRAALQLIRATIEEHCPPGVLPSEEAVNGLYGPTLTGEALALAAAIVATVDRLQLQAAAQAAGGQHQGLKRKKPATA